MDKKENKPYSTAVAHYESTIKRKTRELEIANRVAEMSLTEQVKAEYKLSRKRKLTTEQRIELAILRKGPLKIIDYTFDTEKFIATLTTELSVLLQLQASELQSWG